MTLNMTDTAWLKMSDIVQRLTKYKMERHLRQNKLNTRVLRGRDIVLTTFVLEHDMKYLLIKVV